MLLHRLLLLHVEGHLGVGGVAADGARAHLVVAQQLLVGVRGGHD